MYSYLPENNQVILSAVPPDDQATTTALFLAGKGNLARDFSVSYAGDAATPDTYALKLLPRQRQQDYDWLVLVVDRRSLQIRSLVAADPQGRSTFEFGDFKENTGLSDKTFTFKIPSGVDVVTAGSSRL